MFERKIGAEWISITGVMPLCNSGCHDLTERTEMDLRKYRNGLLWVPKQIGMDFRGYTLCRNGLEQTSAYTETNFNGNQKR